MEKLLIITDLDASLLWHDYTYEEAKPTITKLKALGFPLILNSSKTLAELTALASELESTAPIIAENGGMVAIHENSILKPVEGIDTDAYKVIHTGMSRDTVLEHAHALRDRYNYLFKGFFDMSANDLSTITKLSPEAASKAKQRFVTEPILWEDTKPRFEQFSAQLKEHQIKVIRGGKFIHLMGEVDKAQGAQLAIELYKNAEPETTWTVVAIGDSENDLGMLEIADIPVVIPHDSEIRIHPAHSGTIYASKNASEGWSESMETILNTFNNKH